MRRRRRRLDSSTKRERPRPQCPSERSTARSAFPNARADRGPRARQPRTLLFVLRDSRSVKVLDPGPIPYQRMELFGDLDLEHGLNQLDREPGSTAYRLVELRI